MKNIDEIILLLNEFMKSDYLNIVSFALAIISLALAYVFYKKSKKIIQLTYKSFDYTVIDRINKFENLDISYKGESLESFSISEIRITNMGTTSIKKVISPLLTL